MFRSYKWALLILLNVGMARIGGLLALLVTGTYLSVSSGVGMLALFGVSVQTGVIMLEYINQLRAQRALHRGCRGRRRGPEASSHHDDHAGGDSGTAAGGASHDIGSDSQRPFAIVIVGGLISDLLLSIVLLPTFYVWIARDGDQLPEPEASFEAYDDRVHLRMRVSAVVAVFAACCRRIRRSAQQRTGHGSRSIEAIQLALQHNHNLLAARTTIQQNQAAEITANLRPNPTFFTDWEYLPLFSHASKARFVSDYLQASTEGDMGLELPD